MDRNTWNSIIGFSLIFIIIFVWAKLNAPDEAQLDQQKARQDSLARVEKAIETQAEPQEEKPAELPILPAISDSSELAVRQGQYGSFATASIGEEQEYTLSNPDIDITFTNKGGHIKAVELKKFKKVIHFEGEADDSMAILQLLEDPKNRFDFLLNIQGKQVLSGDLLFQTQTGNREITFTLQSEDGRYLKQTYRIPEKGYALEYIISQSGLQTGTTGLQLEWQNYLQKLEKNSTYEKMFSTVYFREIEGSTDYCSCRASDEKILSNPIKWVSHSNQFFNSTLIADQAFTSGDLKTVVREEDTPDLKLAYSKLTFPALSDGSEFGMTFYIGPNDYTQLEAFNADVEDIIPFGWSFFGTVNRHIIRPVFSFLISLFSSKGLVILLLTLLVKLVLYPLTYKMLVSQAKMGALKPKLAHLKEKFKDDAQQVQIETMKIYREFGVNPLGGCLPMVLQMPIWIALYRFFPASIEFRQESFLWADDLSSYDAFIQLGSTIPMYGDHISLFTLIWVITTIIYTYYSTKEMDMSVNPAMKYVQYAMPVMFLFWFNNYASGLTAYMCISNIFNIGQTLITKNYIINHEKIKEKLEENAKKPKKKGGFQQRLESALKEQQKAQAAKGSGGKKGTKK
ncbi:MAG: membrane protein insertase YidC [Saprospiraceae bacterium]|nr:membrane protein insertase YidC [Saprospiraceae bacterium]